jgi:pre-rRNA-processing protein TSR4
MYSVRALRVLTFNARWAVKLEKKRQREEAKEARRRELQEKAAAREMEEEAMRKKNPFASSGAKIGALGGGLFGGEASLFSPANVLVEKKTSTVEADLDAESEDDHDDLAEEMAIKASLEETQRIESDWTREAPAYHPAQYLNTYAELSSSARAYEESKESKKQLKKLKESGGVGEMKGWEAEKYESMMVSGVDETFERFVKRVSADGKQVVRYEFAGTPLPFHAKGPAYEKLWAKKRPSVTTVSGGAFQAANRDALREYSSDGITPCSLCGSRRVFELQLMPNLVNTLRPEAIVGGLQGDEDETDLDAEKRKRREIEEALGHKLPEKADADGVSRTIPGSLQDDPTKLSPRTGLNWSTAMVFVCENDCRGSESKKGEIWSEEVVELQFEHES